MFTEVITLGAILGGSAIAVWFAKGKFQPEIDVNLTRVENSAAKLEVLQERKSRK